jgi:hypothetical protein
MSLISVADVVEKLDAAFAQRGVSPLEAHAGASEPSTANEE